MLHAWMAANYQGLSPDRLTAMLDGKEAKASEPMAADAVMTVMAKWRVAQAMASPPAT